MLEEISGLFRWQASAIFVAMVLLSVSLSVLPVHGDDQAHSMVDFFQNPTSMSFYSVAWNENTYQYAIAVGYNSSSHNGEIYRYTPDHGWKNIYSSSTDVYYDVVHYRYMGDTFFVVGTRNTDSLVLKVENADDVPSISVIGPSPGTAMYGVALNAVSSPSDFLVCVGEGDDGSGNIGGMIMVHNLSAADSDWNSYYTGRSQSLMDITFNNGGDTPLFIIVGTNTTNSSGVAYGYDMYTFWPIDVPDDCQSLNGVSWYPPDEDGYAIAVGEDRDGKGAAYRISVTFPGPRISYSNSRNPYSLRFLYGSNQGHFYTPVYNAHANFTSIALSPGGAPMIAYYDNLSRDLMYVTYADGKWSRMTVDSDGDVGMYCSIVTDGTGRPYISYYDRTNGNLKIAWYSGVWRTAIVDGSGSAGKYTDMAVDSAGHLHISYIDTSAGLKYAYYNGNSWSIQVVDSSGTGSTSIAVDGDSHPHIAYQKGSGGSYSLEYRFYNGNTWTSAGFSSVSFTTPVRPHIAIDGDGNPHMVAFDDSQGFAYLYKDIGGNWNSETVTVGTNPYQIVHDGDLMLEWNKDIDLFFSYTDTRTSSLPYSLNYTHRTYSNGTWDPPWGVDAPNTGNSISAIMLDDFHTFMKRIPVDAPDGPDMPKPFSSVDWYEDGSKAVIVGMDGEVYIYYSEKSTIALWNARGPSTLNAVATKPPGSPSYALAVGDSYSGIVSTQVADASTSISARNILPHINSMDFMDRYWNSMLNRQVDVGNTYIFWANTSYEEGWEKIGLNITAWYDNYDGSHEYDYNYTPGKNLNFMIHFEPDPVDPYNRSGNCTLLWPGTEEVVLDHWSIDVDDNPSEGSLGINDGHDYYHIAIYVRFGKQMTYAPGPGSWSPAGDQTVPGSAFNDPYSWNFNMTIYDRTNRAAHQSRYDEFGIFAYTEISAQGSPSGSGVPGSTIPLSPSSRIYIRTNVPYNVTVNITDLKNETGASYIPREYVEVLNYNPAGDNTTSNTDLHDWTAFPASPDPLYVWGTSAGDHMWPLPDGTYTAGYQAGYSSSPVYTTLMWRIHIPPGLEEDTFSATITYSIDYQV